MRDNGLSARAYIAVADLDSSTADALLATLRDRGVAAYAADSPDAIPASAAGTVDRLYVDADAAAAVRTLIDEEILGDPRDDGESGNRDVEAEFRAIVAGFDDAVPSGLPGPWPAAEDIDDDAGSAPSDPFRVDGVTNDPGKQHTSWEDALRPVSEQLAGGYSAAEVQAGDTQDRYIPPPPPPLPHGSLRTRLAWLAAAGGPAVLFMAVMLDWQLESWELLLAVVAFLGGVVALVAQLGNDRDDDSGDDGAVV